MKHSFRKLITGEVSREYLTGIISARERMASQVSLGAHKAFWIIIYNPKNIC